MIIFSWNVRELGEATKKQGLEIFCALNLIDIMCFQETKLSNVSSAILRSLAVSQDTIWTTLVTEGSA